MTGLDASAPLPQPAPGRGRLRLPASRGGLAWLAVLLIIGTLLAVQFGRQIYANWEIGQRAVEMEEQIAAVEAENALLQQELDYLRSDAFISQEARRLANLGRPGEQLMIIPPGAEAPLPEEIAARQRPKPLLTQWVELFFEARNPFFSFLDLPAQVAAQFDQSFPTRRHRSWNRGGVLISTSFELIERDAFGSNAFVKLENLVQVERDVLDSNRVADNVDVVADEAQVQH